MGEAKVRRTRHRASRSGRRSAATLDERAEEAAVMMVRLRLGSLTLRLEPEEAAA